MDEDPIEIRLLKRHDKALERLEKKRNSEDFSFKPSLSPRSKEFYKSPKFSDKNTGILMKYIHKH
jgi:hypothetical protein